MEEALRKLKTIFKVPGDGAPEVEVKFRLGGSPDIDKALAKLVDDGVMNKYEFPPGSNSWHYKLKKKISLDEDDDVAEMTSSDGASSQQLKDLSALVEEIAKEIGDDFILNKFKQYKQKYNL